MPDVFDIVELTVDIPERGLRAGMQGTIVECHPGNAYEVEFTNELGETLDFLALRPDQFIVVWRAKTKEWVPIVERIVALMSHLPEGAGEEVLDFARFLHMRRQRSLGRPGSDGERGRKTAEGKPLTGLLLNRGGDELFKGLGQEQEDPQFLR